MNEVAFPVLGVAIVLLLVMPACALLSKALLWLLPRGGSALRGQGGLRYGLLVAPTTIPIAWFISACLHQAESGTGSDVCVIPDAPGVLCPEVVAFALVLILPLALTALPRLLRERQVFRVASTPEARAARERVERLVAPQRDLAPLLRRIVVVESGDDAIATRGVFAARVVVQGRFVRALDDASLLGALRHEAAHLRDRDPLRYFVAEWALAANPLGGWLLRSEFTRWLVARETHCDREAVLAGASATALAHALIRAARFPAPVAGRTALGASGAKVLRLRIGLLLAYAERAPQRHCPEPALRFAVGALLLSSALPHHFGAGGLDLLHRVAEGAAIPLLSAED
jgi:Zn-dependent protease with chaperone function